MVVHRGLAEGAYTDIQRVGDGAVLRAAGVEVPMEELLAFTFPNPEPPRR